jgi:CheY-like chemotaxis protein
VEPDVWPVSGDSTEIMQVLVNLCVNARDAMPNGGTLAIAVRNMPMSEARLQSALQPRPYVQITVTDTGSGIPKEIIDKIYDPFFTSKEHGKGTGLGLSISLGIVRSHGGVIDVRSEVGQGTTFSVYLPAMPSTDVRKTESRSDSQECGHGETILVVDDEQRILDLARATLESYGFTAITAPSGMQALDAVSQSSDPIALALVDMMMPQMDGIETITRIRKLAPQSRIIAMSGLHVEGRVENASLAGANAFLAKPFDDLTLVSVVRQVLAMRQSGDRAIPSPSALDHGAEATPTALAP